MSSNPPIRAVIGLPPKDTVRAFEARDTLRATTHWTEMWQAEHARHFTVAKVARLDLLSDIEAAVADVIANGGTFKQFKDNLIPTLQKAGWWGTVTDKALTGTDAPVNVGPHRLRTIYDTNLRVSRAAGRWSRIQELKGERPFLMYVAINDGRTRPLHRRWGGLDPSQPIRIILPVDHPAWAIYFPPNGWLCRCSVRQLSQRDLDRMGLRVTTDAELKRIGWLTADGTPGGATRDFLRPGTGEVVKVPLGIDPGFGYNVGTASMAAVADKLTRSLERAAASDPAAALATLKDVIQSEAFLDTLAEPNTSFPVMLLDDALRTAIGSEARVAVLSSDTYAKQQARHPELGIDIYRRLPDLGADADIVAVEGDQFLKLARQQNGSWLLSIVKRTADGTALYVTSVRLQAAESLPRLLANTTVILDKRA